MNDYYLQGREAALTDIAEWLKEYAPQKPPEERSFNYLSFKEKARVMKRKLEGYREKVRISLQWREGLMERLGLQKDDTIHAVNTIIELIEHELTQGGTVRLNHFGDFRLINYNYEDGTRSKAVRFFPSRDWVDTYNEPKYANDVGLHRRLTRKGRLERRF